MHVDHELTGVLLERYEALLLGHARELAAVMSDPELSPAEAEREVVRLARRMTARVLGEGLSARWGAHAGAQECDCGSAMEHEGSRRRTVVTMSGAGEYRRAYYRCPQCRSSHYAGDRELGLEQTGYTLPAQDLVCLSAARVPFVEACDHLVRLSGMDVSAKQCQRISGLHGLGLEAEGAAERAELLAGLWEYLPQQRPQRLYVGLDGTMLHFVDGWHEGRVGVVYDVKRGDDGDDEPVQTTYLAGIREPVEQFGARLYQEACQRGYGHAEETVVIGDGAPWIWNLAAEHFPGAVQVLDYYHAAERLHEVARTVFEGPRWAEARAWAGAGCDLLREGELDAVLTRLGELPAQTEAAREAVRQAIGYYETNRERMQYKVLREGGYQIGSGVVEAACKHVMGTRCKRPGMHWSTRGAQHILALRCLYLSQRWDEYWKTAA